MSIPHSPEPARAKVTAAPLVRCPITILLVEGMSDCFCCAGAVEPISRIMSAPRSKFLVMMPRPPFRDCFGRTCMQVGLPMNTKSFICPFLPCLRATGEKDRRLAKKPLLKIVQIAAPCKPFVRGAGRGEVDILHSYLVQHGAKGSDRSGSGLG